MRDVGLIGDLGEPFANLLTQGMVVAPTFYRDLAGCKKQWINPADVDVVTDERGRPSGATLKACLLYTSPSPRDRTRSRMPPSA